MTEAYKQGFLAKCAEHGLSRHSAEVMLKCGARDWDGVPGLDRTVPVDPPTVRKLSKDQINKVNTFFNDIVLPTKKEYAGVPDIDYDAKRYVPDFVKNTKIIEHPAIFDNGIKNEFYNPFSAGGFTTEPTIYRDDVPEGQDTNPNSQAYLTTGAYAPLLNQEMTLVHEITHNTNRDVPTVSYGIPYNTQQSLKRKLEHAGVSRKEQATLDRAYPFTAYTMAAGGYDFDPKQIEQLASTADHEKATTNREYRYAIWDKLSKQLGRNPTYEEFKTYINGLSDREVLNIISAPNIKPWYMKVYLDNDWETQSPLDPSAIRKAWLEVAKNQQGYSGNGVKLLKSGQAVDHSKWPDFREYQKKHNDELVWTARRLVAENLKNRGKWGLDTKSGKILSEKDIHDNPIPDDVIIHSGDKAKETRRANCHELADALLAKLKENRIKARRVFVDKDRYNGVRMGHSTIFFQGKDGKYHRATSGMGRWKNSPFGNFDSLEDAIDQYVAVEKANKQTTDDEMVNAYDTTDIPFVDGMTWKDYLTAARKGRLLYHQEGKQ